MSWKKYKLGELYNVASGLSKSRDQFGFGNPFVTFKDVFYNFFLPDELESLANTTDKEIKSCSVLRGDILLTRTSETMHELGMSSVALKDYPKATFNGFTKRLRLKPEVGIKVDPVFIGYYLRSQVFRNQVSAHATLTTRASLNASAINSIDITIPDFQEQLRIGEILKPLDDKIELNLQINKTLEEMAMTLYKEWLVDFGPFKDGAFIESELGLIPEGWEVKRLGEVTDIGSSKRIFLNEYVEFGVPFYRGKEITELRTTNRISTELFITPEKFAEIKTKFGAPKEGDILITSVGTIGNCYLVRKGNTFYFKDGNITWIKAYTGYLKSSFIYQYLISKETQNQIKSSTIGSTQQALTIQALKNLKICVPPERVVGEISERLNVINKIIETNIEEKSTLIEIRDTLLPKLISGEIRVKEFKKELAEVI